MKDMTNLSNKIKNLDKLIDNYTILISNSTNDLKKSYKIIIESFVNQKIKIKQLICDIKSKKEIHSKQLKTYSI